MKKILITVGIILLIVALLFIGIIWAGTLSWKIYYYEMDTFTPAQCQTIKDVLGFPDDVDIRIEKLEAESTLASELPFNLLFSVPQEESEKMEEYLKSFNPRDLTYSTKEVQAFGETFKIINQYDYKYDPNHADRYFTAICQIESQDNNKITYIINSSGFKEVYSMAIEHGKVIKNRSY